MTTATMSVGLYTGPSQTIRFWKNSPRWARAIYWVTQVITGSAFMDMLLNRVPWFTEHFYWQYTFPVLGLIRINIAAWLLYMALTFYFEGFFIEVMLYVIEYINIRVFRGRIRHKPVDENRLEQILDEILSVEGIAKFLLGALATIVDVALTCQRMLAGLPFGSPLWVIVVILFTFLCLSGEALLNVGGRVNPQVVPQPETTTSATTEPVAS